MINTVCHPFIWRCGAATFKICITDSLWWYQNLEVGQLSLVQWQTVFIVGWHKRSQGTIRWQSHNCQLTGRWWADSHLTVYRAPNPQNWWPMNKNYNLHVLTKKRWLANKKSSQNWAKCQPMVTWLAEFLPSQLSPMVCFGNVTAVLLPISFQFYTH